MMMKLSYKAQKMVACVMWQQHLKLVSAVTQLVRNPPAMWDTWLWSLGWEDPVEKGKGYSLQYSGLENPMDCMVRGVIESDTTDWLSLSYKYRGFPSGSDGERICLQCRRPGFSPWVRKSPWRRKWQPTPVFLPGDMDRGAWRATVRGVSKSQTRLRD